MKLQTRKYLVITLLLLLSLVLIWPALINGYPLVYSDSGTYIDAGFTNTVPVDRPIIYCLFVRYFSLSQSLWFILLVQAAIVSFVIFMLTRKFTSGKTLLVSSLIVCILSFTTGLSNYTSQIMPDIFSALTIIGFAVILITEKMRWKEYLLSMIVVFGVMTNFSNFFVLAGLVVISFFLLLFHYVSLRIFIRGVIIAIIPVLLLLAINRAFTGRILISRAPNVFILARMIETGVVKKYLVDNCDKKNYLLCEQIDSLPATSSEFIWSEKSPLYFGDCGHAHWDYCWDEKNFEFGILIKDIIFSPAYCKELSLIYGKDFFRQICDFKVDVLTSQCENSAPHRCIASRFGNEIDSYINAKQYRNTLEFKNISKIQLFAVILSLLFITIVLFLYKKCKIKKEHTLLTFLLLLGILGNALTVTIFSTVIDRYQARVIWIIPLIALLLAYHYILGRKTNNTLTGKSFPDVQTPKE